MTARKAFIDPHGQKFAPAGGSQFFEIKIPIVLAPDELPPHSWKWDALMFPNKVGDVTSKAMSINEAITAGLVEPNAGPKCLDCLDRGYRLWEITDEREMDRIRVYYTYWMQAYDAELCGCNAEITREHMYRAIMADYCSDNLNYYYRLYAKPEKIPAIRPGLSVEIPRVDTYEQPLMLLSGEIGCWPEAVGVGSRTTNALRFNEKYPDENPAPKPKKKAPVRKNSNPYLSKDELIDMKVSYNGSLISDLLGDTANWTN